MKMRDQEVIKIWKCLQILQVWLHRIRFDIMNLHLINGFRISQEPGVGIFSRLYDLCACVKVRKQNNWHKRGNEVREGKKERRRRQVKRKKLVSLQEEKIVLMSLLPDTGSHIIQDKKKRNKKKTQTMKPSKSIYLNLANHQVWGQFTEPSSLLLILELVWSTWDVSVFLSRK